MSQSRVNEPSAKDDGVKRLAMQLAMQLPHEREEALKVLTETRLLVTRYLHPRQRPRQRQKLRVVGE